MTYELIGEDRCVVEDFYEVDGECGNLCEHYSPQRVCSFEVEVLYDEVGALVVGLKETLLVSRTKFTAKRPAEATCLKKAHVDRAAFWIVIHRALRGPTVSYYGCQDAVVLVGLGESAR